MMVSRRRATLILCSFAALLTFAVGRAHASYDSHPKQASLLESRIGDYRLEHNRHFVHPSLQDHAVSVAIAKANYHEARYSTSIEGVPYQVWADEIYGPDPSALLLTRRCHGRAYSPRQALHRMLSDDELRRDLRMRVWRRVGVVAVDVKRDRGDFKGLGTCRIYYVSLSANRKL